MIEITGLPRASGVYALVNQRNGKRYIGSSTNIYKRCHAHRSLLHAGNHDNEYLQRAWAVEPDAFYIAILELVGDRHVLRTREQFHIDSAECINKDRGYNLSPTANVVTHTVETRAKISATKRGTICTDAHRKKLALALKGHKVSPEARAAQSAKNRLWERTPEMRAKMALAKLGKKRPPRTAEHSRKLSEALKGHPVSAETRAKLALAAHLQKRRHT